MCLDVQTKPSFYSSHNPTMQKCPTVGPDAFTVGLKVQYLPHYRLYCLKHQSFFKTDSLIRVCPPQLSYVSQFPADCWLHENIVGISL